MIEEIWKDINDWEGLYQVSNYGRIKSLARKCYYPGCARKQPYYFNIKEKILKPILLIIELNHIEDVNIN